MKSGFTFIEMAITLAMVAILTVVSIPSFTSIIHNHQTAVSAESLYNFLQYARSEAVKQNKIIYVSFTTGNSWCYGVNTNSACNCTIANNCNLGTVSAANATQTTLSTTSITGNSISFENVHGAANAAGSVTFTIYGQAPFITINIGRLGNLQMCSTGISGYAAC